MRAKRPSRSRRAGYTLIEVMVATLITALLAVATIEVALSTKSNSVRLDRRILANQTSKAVQSALKAYVTGDPNSTATGLCGPNTLNGGTLNARGMMTSCTRAMWCISNSLMTDSPGGGGSNPCYALNPGTHILSCTGMRPPPSLDDRLCLLPYALVQPPYNGYVQYTVTYSAAGAPPQVAINVNWTEPPP